MDELHFEMYSQSKFCIYIIAYVFQIYKYS